MYRGIYIQSMVCDKCGEVQACHLPHACGNINTESIRDVSTSLRRQTLKALTV